MVDFDRIEGISPEVIELSEADVQKHNAPQVISSATPSLRLEDMSLEAEKVIRIFGSFAEFARQATTTLKTFINAIHSTLEDVACIAVSPDSRVKHLAQYSKKHRVRKKNIARLKKQLKNAKGKMQSCELVFSEEQAPEDIWVCQNIEGEREYDSNNN